VQGVVHRVAVFLDVCVNMRLVERKRRFVTEERRDSWMMSDDVVKRSTTLRKKSGHEGSKAFRENRVLLRPQVGRPFGKAVDPGGVTLSNLARSHLRPT
jgi:hypothetical protein